jgi:FemAB-related protein (PEP-CTERM system-associated)
MTVDIVSCDQSWREQWQAYVSTAPGGSLYHRFEWKDVLESCFGHRCAFLAAVENGRIVGVFPLAQLKSRLFGNIACSLPFVNYGGPIGDRGEIVTALLDASRDLADVWKVEYIEIRSRAYLGDALPVADHKVSMTVDLADDPDVLWKAYKTDHRKDIKRGYNNGFTVKHGSAELVDDFFAVFSESWRDLGTPVYAKSYFQRIVDALGPSARLAVVYHEGQPAAAAFDGIHGTTVEGMWLGTRSQYRHRNVGYVLYWELLKDACNGTLKQFHLGRSTTQSGGETFMK